MCVLTNKRYKTYPAIFSFCHLDHAPVVGLGGAGGGGGGGGGDHCRYEHPKHMTFTNLQTTSLFDENLINVFNIPFDRLLY